MWMRNLYALAGLALALCAGPALAADGRVEACLDRATTLEQRECVQALVRAAAGELDQAYRGALDAAARDTTAPGPGAFARRRDAIVRSQQAWEAYRDAECRGVADTGAGSGRLVWVFGCLAEKTLERIAELRTPFFAR
jgi:uncharacterized protein YecT (DUF1311 family)